MWWKIVLAVVVMVNLLVLWAGRNRAKDRERRRGGE